jgi:glycosyltransferase involved in cell wall biosynthesis
MDLSVIVPVYNEGENIRELSRQLAEVLPSITADYEVIFIDDGSTDNTKEILEELHSRDKSVKAIRFRRNFGQSAAMDAGFKHAKGEIVVSMDGDLQNDPRDIPKLLKKLDEGYDVVCGWRHKRADPPSKKIPSALSNWLRKRLTDEEIHDSGCSLRAYMRNTLDDLELYGETHRYIPAMLRWRGYRIGEFKVRHNPRIHGKSKYNTSRLVNGLMDLFFIKFWTDYSTRPLHFFGTLGLLQYVLSTLIFIEQVIKALIIGELTAGPLLILVVLLLITGTLSITLGFLGEILVRTYYMKSGVTPYSIEKTLLD